MFQWWALDVVATKVRALNGDVVDVMPELGDELVVLDPEPGTSVPVPGNPVS
jgi:hypothetical protein